MTFVIENSRYASHALLWSGLPATIIEGDAAPDDIVEFTIELTEDLAGDLRRALINPQGFWAEFAAKEHFFSVRDARLTSELPEVDYARRRLTISFALKRSSIVKMDRPMGRYPQLPEDAWNRELWTYSQDVGLHHRRRAEVAKAQAELDEKRVLLNEHAALLDRRKADLIGRGMPELIEAAEKRGVL